MPSILGIIPARSGSKRVPMKNLRKLAGKTLVEYAIDAALDSRLLNYIALSSDSTEILKLADSYNNKIWQIQRPDEISGDTSTALEYVEHTLEVMKGLNLETPQYVVIIQPSSPFTKGEDIDATIRRLLELKTDCAVSVREVQFDLHPSKFKYIRDGKLLPYFEDTGDHMARHLLDKIYVRNGSVYMSSIELIRSRKLLNDSCAAYVMPPERSIDINDLLDLEFAEFLLQKNVKK
ncbi:MAG: acylneuraminate cytidylyltransferase family protein [Saprospiraceae bacterium]|nr:acylneuraminate cytidylyltransferase family protein [Saprospiraceae bacterium]